MHINGILEDWNKTGKPAYYSKSIHIDSTIIQQDLESVSNLEQIPESIAHTKVSPTNI